MTLNRRLLAPLLVFAFILPLSGCGADSFLRTSARLSSYLKSTRVILENAYEDKVLQRETVQAIARPAARVQSGALDAFTIWKRHRDPNTGDLTITPEIAAEFAALIVSLKSDFAAFKLQAASDKLPSPATIALAPALKVLESELNDFTKQLSDIKGVSKRGGVFRLLKAQQDEAERLYAELLKESEDLAVWTN